MSVAYRHKGVLGERLVISLFFLSCLASACQDAPPGASVLLITIDTLRADHVGAYTPDTSRTPRLDELARGGTVFENAVAPMPLTRPSLFSILTSRYPREHGVLNNAISLPESAVTLAEIFRDHGYRTAAFVSVVLLDEESGAAQGFEEFRYPADSRQQLGETTVSEALSWISGLDPGEPFFLWIHLFDPHLPYAPPPPFGRDLDPQLAASLPEVNWPQFYAVAESNDGDIPQAVFDHALALYRGEVEYTDHCVGRLLDGLEAQGRREGTIIAFTADHGEGFENGVYFEHADSLYDGAVRIPLIVTHPPVFRPRSRVSAQVSNLDIAPSLLMATGIEVPRTWSGRPLQEAESFGDRYVMIQHPFYQPSLARYRPKRRSAIRSVAGHPLVDILVEKQRIGIVGTEWKLVRSGGASELYLRATGESADVAGENDEIRRQLEAVLARELEEHPLNLIDTDQINEELLSTLRALGYMQ